MTMASVSPITVVEMDEFVAATRKLMDEKERLELIDYLAYHPTAGVIVPGTGGVRKVRWGLEGRGKRGGARVIYFYHDMDMPLFLLEAYAKNERDTLSQASCRKYQFVTKQIVEAHKRRRSKG